MMLTPDSIMMCRSMCTNVYVICHLKFTNGVKILSFLTLNRQPLIHFDVHYRVSDHYIHVARATRKHRYVGIIHIPFKCGKWYLRHLVPYMRFSLCVCLHIWTPSPSALCKLLTMDGSSLMGSIQAEQGAQQVKRRSNGRNSRSG
jgi:hypothetical protein